ncbi:MAG TPA: alpha/beta hydrolase [Acidimicrobiales bacterium]|nr:alpha/beta hydrolase [Acidimicrobiales bacterium]
MPTFMRDDLRLHYGARGRPDGRPVVLMHGLLWSSRMLERVAALLPEQRIVLLDLHGHGKSDKPTDPIRYTWAELTADLVGLLDHLGVERAVVGGLSLGANVALAAAHEHARRMDALVLEMPVLLRGHRVGRPAFSALAAAYAGAAPFLAPASRVLARLPAPRGRLPEAAAMRDVASLDPRVARAILTGLLAEAPIAEDEASLRRLTMPALVIAHRNDPLHALADARDLVARLPDATLVEASSIVEYRIRPATLARHLRHFLATVPD